MYGFFAAIPHGVTGVLVGAEYQGACDMPIQELINTVWV